MARLSGAAGLAVADGAPGARGDGPAACPVAPEQAAARTLTLAATASAASRAWLARSERPADTASSSWARVTAAESRTLLPPGGARRT